MFWQVGAPPGIACFLDEIRRENDLFKQDAVSTYWGDDPELDEFMVPSPTLLSLSLSLYIYIYIYIYICTYIFFYGVWVFLICLVFLRRKPTVICWWSINLILKGLLMKQQPSWTRLKCSFVISALVPPSEASLVSLFLLLWKILWFLCYTCLVFSVIALFVQITIFSSLSMRLKGRFVCFYSWC